MSRPNPSNAGVSSLISGLRRAHFSDIRRYPLASSRVSSLPAPVHHEAKSKAGIGRPLYPYHDGSLVVLDRNVQDPIAGRPN
jgi:hypothetical protein